MSTNAIRLVKFDETNGAGVYRTEDGRYRVWSDVGMSYPKGAAHAGVRTRWWQAFDTSGGALRRVAETDSLADLKTKLAKHIAKGV